MSNNKRFKLTFKCVKRRCSFKFNIQQIPNVNSKNYNIPRSNAYIISYNVTIRMLPRVMVMNVTNSNKHINQMTRYQTIYSIKHEARCLITIDAGNI